jgi:hypothetical protein
MCTEMKGPATYQRETFSDFEIERSILQLQNALQITNSYFICSLTIVYLAQISVTQDYNKMISKRWGSQSSTMLCRVVWYKQTDISEVLTASIIRLQGVTSKKTVMFIIAAMKT